MLPRSALLYSLGSSFPTRFGFVFSPVYFTTDRRRTIHDGNPQLIRGLQPTPCPCICSSSLTLLPVLNNQPDIALPPPYTDTTDPDLRPRPPIDHSHHSRHSPHWPAPQLSTLTLATHTTTTLPRLFSTSSFFSRLHSTLSVGRPLFYHDHHQTTSLAGPVLCGA